LEATVYEFMTEEWIDAVEALAADAPVPEGAADLTVNLTVTGGLSGETAAHLTAGRIGRGHIAGAATTVRVPVDVARSLLVDTTPDPGVVMSAFTSGRIQVDGDMTALLNLASGLSPTPDMLEFRQQIQALTLISEISPANAAAAASSAARSSGPTPGGADALRMVVEPMHPLCCGHGRCVKICPEVFAIDPATGCVDVRLKTPPPELHEKVRSAVYACPSKAILVSLG
jgi:ferredoxin